MSQESAQDRKSLTGKVKASLRKAEEIASRLRKTNVYLLVAGIMGSAASTLVAGITAAQGPVVGGEGIEGWRIACIIAAVFAFISTVSTGLSQQLKISNRLSEGTQCVGKLRSLEVMISTGSRDWEEIIKEYEEIAKTYPEFIN
jgi:MFS family permease